MVQFGIWVYHKVINPLRPVTHAAWLSLSQTRFWDLDKILISDPIQSTWWRLKPPTSIWAERQPEAGIVCFQTSVDFKHIWSSSAHSLHCLWMAHTVSRATYKYRVTLLKKKKSMLQPQAPGYYQLYPIFTDAWAEQLSSHRTCDC